ncbi:hypothetical protein PMAYCL1PPCAC_08379, partial [Pristionchus mayeri]
LFSYFMRSILMAPSKKRKVDADKVNEQASAVAECERNYKQKTGTDTLELAKAEFKPVNYVVKDQNYKLPEKFIKDEPKNEEEIEQKIEYEVDDEDLLWLEETNKMRKREYKRMIEEEEFEFVVDRFEKETFRKSQSRPKEGDNEKLGGCCICGGNDYNNVNTIVYCEMCQIGVHQFCYGVLHLPIGSWLCRKCKLAPDTPVKCELCPMIGAALKPTAEGKWAHVACAIWIPEVHIDNAPLKAIEGVGEALKANEKRKCSVCKRDDGAVVQCCRKKCSRSFHVTCAQNAGLQMKEEWPAETTIISSDVNAAKRSLYCSSHGSRSQFSEKNYGELKREAAENIRASRAGGERDARSFWTGALPELDSETIDDIAATVGERSVAEDIWAFYLYKRTKRGGEQLLERLENPPNMAARLARKELLAKLIAANASSPEKNEEALVEQKKKIRVSRVKGSVPSTLMKMPKLEREYEKMEIETARDMPNLDLEDDLMDIEENLMDSEMPNLTERG